MPEFEKTQSGGGPFDMKTYGQGKNPILKKGDTKTKKGTKFTDKVKAFGGAMVDVGAAGENLGRFGRHYRSRKRAYRRDDAVKKEK